jgi:hypothetical protein
MSLLLIWQEIPDSIQLYVFPDNHEDIENLKLCHNLLVNGDDWKPGDPVDFLNEKLSDENGVNHYLDYLVYSNNTSEHAYNKYMIERPFDLNINTIVVSGFYL